MKKILYKIKVKRSSRILGLVIPPILINSQGKKHCEKINIIINKIRFLLVNLRLNSKKKRLISFIKFSILFIRIYLYLLKMRQIGTIYKVLIQ